jgi:alcohol dehydrogenase (cytochrome c)
LRSIRSTGLIYASTWDVPRIQKVTPPRPQAPGANSTGVTARNPVVRPGDVLGHFTAIDPLTGEKKWEMPLVDFPGAAGMLATAGGLVFSGKLTGEFVALDAATGRRSGSSRPGPASTPRRSPTRMMDGSTSRSRQAEAACSRAATR